MDKLYEMTRKADAYTAVRALRSLLEYCPSMCVGMYDTELNGVVWPKGEHGGYTAEEIIRKGNTIIPRDDIGEKKGGLPGMIRIMGDGNSINEDAIAYAKDEIDRAMMQVVLLHFDEALDMAQSMIVERINALDKEIHEEVKIAESEVASAINHGKELSADGK